MLIGLTGRLPDEHGGDKLRNILRFLQASVALAVTCFVLYRLAPYICEVIFPKRALSANVPTVVPYSLLSSMSSPYSEFYWFALSADKLKEDLVVDLTLSILPPGTVVAESVEFPGLLISRQKPTISIDPRISIDEDVKSFILKWEAIPTQGTSPRQMGDSVRISVLQRGTIDWDLLSPSKEPLTKNFLLASLVAWTNLNNETIEYRAESLAQEALKQDAVVGDPGSVPPSSWYKAVYDGLLKRDFQVKVPPDPFPMRKRQTVRSPIQLMGTWEQKKQQRHEVTPLEAALLMAALTREEKEATRLRLFALPEVGSQAPARVLYFCWYEAESWQSISINDAEDLGFDANHEVSTARIRETLSDDIEKALSGNGVYLRYRKDEPRLIALDVQNAQSTYQIGGLS